MDLFRYESVKQPVFIFCGQLLCDLQIPQKWQKKLRNNRAKAPDQQSKRRPCARLSTQSQHI